MHARVYICTHEKEKHIHIYTDVHVNMTGIFHTPLVWREGLSSLVTYAKRKCMSLPWLLIKNCGNEATLINANSTWVSGLSSPIEELEPRTQVVWMLRPRRRPTWLAPSSDSKQHTFYNTERKRIMSHQRLLSNFRTDETIRSINDQTVKQTFRIY